MFVHFIWHIQGFEQNEIEMVWHTMNGDLNGHNSCCHVPVADNKAMFSVDYIAVAATKYKPALFSTTFVVKKTMYSQNANFKLFLNYSATHLYGHADPV